MKSILSLCLIWTLFLTVEAQLQCQTCANLQCTSTVLVNCTSGDTRCVTAAFRATVAGSPETTGLLRGCTSTILCPTVSNVISYSADISVVSIAASALCCETNGCNTQNVDLPPSQPANNGLQCFTCDGITDTVCNTTINCTGVEDRCFSATVMAGPTSVNAFGCVSANLCAGLSQPIPGIGTLFNFTNPPTCCEGNCCNSAWGVELSVFPMLLGLFASAFIY